MEKLFAFVMTMGDTKAKTGDASAADIEQMEQLVEALPTTSTEDIPSPEDENEAIVPDMPRGIDEELLRKYLKSIFMGSHMLAAKPTLTA